jgi:hypothetical protein
VVQGRQILGMLLVGPLACAGAATPTRSGALGTLGKLLAGLVRMVASPTGLGKADVVGGRLRRAA